MLWELGRRPKRTLQIVANSFGRNGGYSAFRVTSACRRSSGKRDRRVGAGAKRLAIPSCAKHDAGRYSVRSGVPVWRARSAGKFPKSTTGRSSSQVRCSGKQLRSPYCARSSLVSPGSGLLSAAWHPTLCTSVDHAVVLPPQAQRCVTDHTAKIDPESFQIFSRFAG